METFYVTKSNLLKACLFLVCAALIGFVSGNSNEKKTFSAKFPDKLNQRVVLSVTNSLEREHVVLYANDGLSKVSERIEYVDGTTTLIQYDGSQFARKLTEFYPDSNQSGKRRVKSEIVFMTGSSDFQSHKAYRPDGTTIKIGERQKDGTYETFTLYEDGKTVEKNQISTPDQFVQTQKVWRKDGSTEKIITTDKNRYVFVWNYRPNNTLWMMYIFSTKGWSMPSGKFYDLDGKSVQMEFKLYSDQTVFVYPNSAGQAEYQVSYRPEAGEKSILALNPATQKPLFEQRWKHVSGNFDCTGTFSFIQTELFKPESDYASHKVERRILASELGDNSQVELRLVQQPALVCLTLPEIKTR